MLKDPRIERISRPWPDIIETVLGTLVLWGAQVAGSLVVSRQGTQWLLVGSEAIVLLALLGLHLLGEDAFQSKLVLAGGILLGMLAGGLAIGESGSWFWVAMAGVVMAGFVLRSLWAMLLYPLPLFLAAYVVDDELSSILMIMASIFMVFLVGIGALFRHLYHAHHPAMARRSSRAVHTIGPA